MEIYALLTGRGNNTLKNKNVIEVLGHPLLYYSAHACRKSKYVNGFFCSSDDSKILQEASKEGYIEIVRPKALALPTSQHVECIKHALEVMKDNYTIPDILVVLLANNVTVKTQWIDDCIEKMKSNMSLSAVVPVYEDNDHHPLRAKRIDADGKLQMYEKYDGNISTNRQDLPKCVFLAHNFWILNVKYMLEHDYKGQQPWEFMGDNIEYMQIESSIDVHNELDLILAEEWLKKNY